MSRSNPRKSQSAASLARFAETGQPKNPFERALMRAWTRIEDVITDRGIQELRYIYRKKS